MITTTLNVIVGLLSILSASSIIYSLMKDREGKTPIFVIFTALICLGNFISGLHRLTEACGLSERQNLMSLFLNKAYPFNDMMLLLAGFLLSYMILNYHIGDEKAEK